MGEGQRPVPGAAAPGELSTPVADATAPASPAGRVVGSRLRPAAGEILAIVTALGVVVTASVLAPTPAGLAAEQASTRRLLIVSALVLGSLAVAAASWHRLRARLGGSEARPLDRWLAVAASLLLTAGATVEIAIAQSVVAAPTGA
jgi:hypothetical protein